MESHKDYKIGISQLGKMLELCDLTLNYME